MCKVKGRQLWWCQHLWRALPAHLQLLGIAGACWRLLEFPRWVLGLGRASQNCGCGTLQPPFLGWQLAPGWLSSTVLVALRMWELSPVREDEGTRGWRGGGWLRVVPPGLRAQSGSAGGCHRLVKMELELLGDGLEKDGRGNGEDRFPLSVLCFPPPPGIHRV